MEIGINAKRRNLFVLLGSALLGWPALAVGDRKIPATAPTRSTVTPRHVLCILGGKDGLASLRKTAQTAIHQCGEGFSIDESYSMDTEDDLMKLSFAVCWDRVAENSFSEADERAVLEHRSVLYVLGPPMMAEKTIAISATALRFVQFMLDGGALAAKGESAGVAHEIDRWKELADQAHDAAISNDSLALASTCRLPFARRPVGDPTAGQSMETVIADFIGAIATRMTEYGVGETITRDRYSLSDDERYEDDSYKFNPFGVITIKSVSL